MNVGPDLDIWLAVSDILKRSLQSNVQRQWSERVQVSPSRTLRRSDERQAQHPQYIRLDFHSSFCIDLHWYLSVVCLRSVALVRAHTHLK